jgi:hypothetical protein
MQNWVKTLPLNGSNLTVTGYSLGGHLAAAFNELNPGVASATYTFNGAGIGKPVAGGLNAVYQEFNNRRQPGTNLDLFTNAEVRSLYLSLYGDVRNSNSDVSLVTTNSIALRAESTLARTLKRFKNKPCRTMHLQAKSAPSRHKICAKRSQIHSGRNRLAQLAAMAQGASS